MHSSFPDHKVSPRIVDGKAIGKNGDKVIQRLAYDTRDIVTNESTTVLHNRYSPYLYRSDEKLHCSEMGSTQHWFGSDFSRESKRPKLDKSILSILLIVEMGMVLGYEELKREGVIFCFIPKTYIAPIRSDKSWSVIDC